MKKYFVKNFGRKKVLVLGFAREGISTFKLLRKYLPEQKIFIADKSPTSKLGKEAFEIIENDQNVSTIFGKEYLDQLNNFDIAIKSPGISPHIPKIHNTKKNGVLFTSQAKIFFDLCQGNIIGVTGTKGKSTTSSIIYSILKKDGKDVSLVGNIGTACLDVLTSKKSKHYVFELSSFQLHDLKKSPHISVVLNISSEHLDWHKSAREYIKSKKNIVKYQSPKDFSVINFDYKESRNFRELSNAKCYYFSTKSLVIGSYVSKGKIFINLGGKIQVVGETSNLKLKGKHNWENVLAAICASFLAGAGIDVIKKAVFSFEPLEHRLEELRGFHDILFVNDSLSTTPDSAISALMAYDGKQITIILGGYDRGLDYSNIAKYISKHHGIINCVILTGESSKRIQKALAENKYGGKIFSLGKAKMKLVVKTACKCTKKGGIILLSPAAASFDMFKNYKDRGDQFKKAVIQLE